MKKKLILGTILTLSLAFIVSAACVAPAFAITTHKERLGAAGTTLIDVPGHTAVIVLAQHFDWGDFYKGSADRLQFFVSTGLPAPAPPFKPVATFEDNPTRIAFSQVVGKGAPVTLVMVGRCQIETYQICKTVVVHWKIPLVIPATSASPAGPATPAVTLPPGFLVLRGYGDAQSDVSDGGFPISGWSYTYEATGYNAKATLFCQGWHYWGPVGETGRQPSIATKGTITWTGP
jgi:hypothetical protein